ncbi:MAG: hypothetical protein ACYC3F_07330 [Gemmatimonadaceae bacterium]
MTTPTNPNPPLGDPDDLRGLPTHEIPWQQTGYRDENARLLVDAIYRHRVTLMRRHADVPVQGYEVLSAEEGPSGAMTCGVLISLWLGCAQCRGDCPLCSDLVLAFAVGGFEDQWMVTGVCTGCGLLSHRASPKTDLLAELNRGLRQTPYPLLSEGQFLASNGHQHLALLSVLASLGETLLPPDYYGFVVAMPDIMQKWSNPVVGRARHWAHRATVRHAPTGACVEAIATVYGGLVDFVMTYLCRTGTLPELDHDGPAQLRYSFPMISQEPVVFPRRRPNEDVEIERGDDVEPGSAFQADVDALIAKVNDGEDADELLQRVQEQLEADPEWRLRAAMGMFLNPGEIAQAYEVIDDDEVREALELRQNQRVTPARRIQFLEQYVLPALCDDADVTHMFVSAVLTSSDGDELMLMASIQGYSFTIIRTEWWGIVESEEAFRASLLERGWIEGLEWFQKLPAKRKLAIVTGEAQARPTPDSE